MTIFEGTISSRRMLVATAVVLALALIALLLYILFHMKPDIPSAGVPDETRGLRTVLVLDGPGVGANPDFKRPLGAALGSGGTIYVADTGNNRICVFSADGEFEFEFGGFGVAKPASGIEPTWEPGLFNFPTAVAIDDDGLLYVADLQNNQIQVFKADGTFIRRFPDPLTVVGRGGSGQGGLGIAVTGLAIHDDLVYATDEFQIVVFTREGEFVRQFGRPGTGPADFDRPNGLVLDKDGSLYVADSNNNRLVAYGPDGTVRWALGGPVTDISRAAESIFGLPRDVAVTGRGTLVVIDAFEFEIVEVDADGEEIARYGQRGSMPGQFNFPNSIDVRGERLLVADKENDRVQLLELFRE
ncbi:MAG: 6-bladed beta-propeller [Coriobacteriia bacterium]|nr:6-bladed beta-propeller [Coriobacteriia bacterium]